MWPFTAPYPERRAHHVDGKSFDFIIVGGGTAGCVIASRLSQDPNVSVLLLCKGRVNDKYIYRVPIICQLTSERPFECDRIESEPVPECNGKQLQVSVCHALGGATRINGLMLTRDPPASFNQWANMGNPDWSWDKVEPYFKKFENAHSHSGADHRGHDGMLECVRQVKSSLTTFARRTTSLPRISISLLSRSIVSLLFWLGYIESKTC
jgi:choline dehydrogenase-like flavoprotein